MNARDFLRCAMVAALVGLAGTGSALSTVAETPKPATGTEPLTEKNFTDALGLALQGISLFQGDNGVELWRLKASWAHLTQDGGVINVDKPVMRYTLGEPSAEDFLDVVADKGKLTDNQQHLELWGHVVVTRNGERVTGPRLTYETATRVMVFPDGATLEGDTADGTATVFTWNLADNVMQGDEGVSVLLKARVNEAEPGSQLEPDQKEPGV